MRDNEAPPATVRAVSIALALITSGCGDDGTTTTTADDTWGPLAVIDGGPSGDGALIAGSLNIDTECVTLTEAGDDVPALLVWPSEGTTWHPESRTISYDGGTGAVELADGDEVTFGGGGDSTDEGGRTAEEWIESIDDWASEPDPGCPAELRWFVGSVVP